MKISFLSLNSYPILTGKNLGYAGGAEVEQANLGSELLAKGHKISFITYDDGEGRTQNVGGIEVIKTYDREKSSEINIILRYKSIWSALKIANADICFHESGSTGVLPLFCYVNRKKFIYRIPSDAVILSRSLSKNYGFNETIVNTLEIKRADVVIAQSEFQKRVMRERFKVESVVIKNGLTIPRVACDKPTPPVVLWVGSLSKVKNPQLFVELARLMPNVLFEMVGGATADRDIYEYVKKAERKLSNFKYHGFVPYSKINRYFNRASIFVNTSFIEGFPNTFIQAWAHYTPVVSLNVDPDQIIQNEKLGFCSGTFKQLGSDVTFLLENEALRKIMGENGRRYVEREHDIREVVKSYVAVFETLFQGLKMKNL